MARKRKIGEKQLALRTKLWPEITDDDLWVRTQRDGFTTIPRTLPLIMKIMDDLSKNQPLSHTYLELWARVYDEGFVTITKPQDFAFHSGHSGQRKESTWRSKMKKLDTLGFINIQPGSSGEITYAIILNPYKVIKKLYEAKTPGITAEKYNALVARAIDIGANDLDEDELDDEIPF